MSLDLRCGTCGHWKPLAPETSDDGECSAIGVSVYLKSRHVVLAGNIMRGPESPTLVTPQTFGCVRWESR